MPAFHHSGNSTISLTLECANLLVVSLHSMLNPCQIQSLDINHFTSLHLIHQTTQGNLFPSPKPPRQPPLRLSRLLLHLPIHLVHARVHLIPRLVQPASGFLGYFRDALVGFGLCAGVADLRFPVSIL